MAVADAQVASIAGLLVLLVAVEIDLARRGMVVVLSRRDCSPGVGKLVHIGRGRRHTQCERAEHYCQNRQKLAQNQHNALLMARHMQLQRALVAPTLVSALGRKQTSTERGSADPPSDSGPRLEFIQKRCGGGRRRLRQRGFRRCEKEPALPSVLLIPSHRCRSRLACDRRTRVGCDCSAGDRIAAKEAIRGQG